MFELEDRKGAEVMNVNSMVNENRPPATAFDSSNGASNARGGSQASPSSDLTANSFITLLTTQLQAQDPLNPLDPNQMVNELTSMNTLQQIMQIREDMDALVAASKNSGGTAQLSQSNSEVLAAKSLSANAGSG